LIERRKKWAYSPPPAQVAPDHPLISPRSGTIDFAMFPAINGPAVILPAAPIRLKFGKHQGPNWGFGYIHIWREHFTGVGDAEEAKREVIALVESVLVDGAPIFYEIGRRAAIFRGSEGQVIVELRGTDEYSVVTAFKHANAKGSRIGAL